MKNPLLHASFHASLTGLTGIAMTLGITTTAATAAAADNPKSPIQNPKSPPPNIVIILADDLGYGDVGYTGCKDIRTPNIDRFAATSVRLDNFHVCPICSPTRAGLMTGRWPQRYGLMKAVIPPWQDFALPLAEQILPQLLAPAGYEERAMFGKWHLGHARLAYLPANRGFTTFYGLYNGSFSGASGYFTHAREGETDWHRDIPGKVSTVHEKGYSTDLLATDAIKFIEKDHAGKPWLAYIAFNAVHEPLTAKPEDLAKYDGLKDLPQDTPRFGRDGQILKGDGSGGAKKSKTGEPRNRRQIYAAMTDSLDQNVGRILAAIDKLPDAANTLVLFFSDNGGLLPFSRNLPYRGGKLSVYEGGIHIPAAIRWPAAGLIGGKTSNALIGYIDIVPTLLTAAGLPHPAAGSPNALDGIDIVPILRGEKPAPDRPWFSYFDQNHDPAASVIEGDWKLVAHNGDVLAPGATPATAYELYNLAKDPSEKTNIIKDHPDIAKRLKARLTEFGKMTPATGVSSREEGREGFKAPKDWIITKP